MTMTAATAAGTAKPIISIDVAPRSRWHAPCHRATVEQYLCRTWTVLGWSFDGNGDGDGHREGEVTEQRFGVTADLDGDGGGGTGDRDGGVLQPAADRGVEHLVRLVLAVGGAGPVNAGRLRSPVGGEVGAVRGHSP